MMITDLLEEIRNTPQLNKEEVKVAFIKAQIGNQEEMNKAFRNLQQHYLPLTLEYVKLFCELFPEQVKSENDIFTLINDGFFLLSLLLKQYSFNADRQGNGFIAYYRNHLKVQLKNDMLDKNAKEDLIINELHDEPNMDSNYFFSVFQRHLGQEFNKLNSQVQEVLRFRYGYYGNQPKSNKDTASILNDSPKNIERLRSAGIKQLRAQLSYEEVKTLLYGCQNRKYIIR